MEVEVRGPAGQLRQKDKRPNDDQHLHGEFTEFLEFTKFTQNF